MEEKINAIKEKLSRYTTEEIVSVMATEMLYSPDKENSIQESTGLESTDMQFKYTVGLLLSTEYICKESQTDNTHKALDPVLQYQNEIKAIYKDIKEITDDYLNNFFPKENQVTTDTWKIKRTTMLPTFIGYFYQSTLCHEEQVVNRIKNWFSIFDESLKEEYGVDTELLLDFYFFIKSRLKDSVQNTKGATNALQEFWFENIGKYSEEEINQMSEEELSTVYDYLINNPKKSFIAKQIEESFSSVFKINVQDIISKYGESKGLKLIELFSIERGGLDYTYFTQDNPIAYKPLIKISNDSYIVINSRMIIDGIYNTIYKSLENIKGNSFYEKRGVIVEEEVLNCFKRILGDDVKYYTSVCETPKNDEHDILIDFQRNLLIIEVKSSKTKEPRRDPDSGYDRIKEHFNSKKGVGGGYLQANKLKKKILEYDELTLYNRKTEPFEIKGSDYDKIHLIVITAEQFGFLNVNSSTLLKKDENDTYFWSCDLYNLENLIDGFIYLNKKGEDFINYVDQRIRYHEKFLVLDELEIAEYYLVKEEFDDNIQFGRAQTITFLPTESNFFDKIKFENLNIPYNYDSEINCVSPILTFAKGVSKKIGRNDPCPCGSGMKYKKCHGK